METRKLDTAIYEKDGPVAWITFDYQEKANIQSSGLVFDVDECLDDADRDYDIKVVVLKANGPGFSAGHVVTGSPGTEMREIDESTARLGSPWKGQWEIYGAPVMKLWDFPKVTIAQVHGYCLGGGTVWGLLTDMTVASEDAYFQFPVLQGMAMPCMETGIEPWLFMNWKRASEYMYTAQELERGRGQGHRPHQPGGPSRSSRGRSQRARLPCGASAVDDPDGGQGEHQAGLGPDGSAEPSTAEQRPPDRGHLGQGRAGIHPRRLSGRLPAPRRVEAQRGAGEGSRRRVKGTTPKRIVNLTPSTRGASRCLSPLSGTVPTSGTLNQAREGE